MAVPKKGTAKAAPAKKTAAKKPAPAKATPSKKAAPKKKAVARKTAPKEAVTRKPVVQQPAPKKLTPVKKKKAPQKATPKKVIPPLDEPIIAAPVMEPSELSEVAIIDEDVVADFMNADENIVVEGLDEITVIEGTITFPEEKNDPVPDAFKEQPHDPFHGHTDPAAGQHMNIPTPKKPRGGSRKK